MKGLLRSLVYGEWLRHRPVGLAAANQAPVQAIASGASDLDLTGVLYPVSLNPLVLGITRRRGEPRIEVAGLHMRDIASGDELGSIALAPVGMIEHPAGCVDLFRARGSRVRCVPAPYRNWRYATAWRHMQVNARRPGAFHVGFADLKALNVFYMMPRPVFLVTVRHGEAGNVFPMDLVGPWGEDSFLLALRSTSRSIDTILASGRIAISAMPAQSRAIVYNLGSQHRKGSIDWDDVGLETIPSPTFGFPVPAQSLGLRELEVRHSEPIGSHRFFVTRIVHETKQGSRPQLCHVSDMYARWRAKRGDPFTDA